MKRIKANMGDLVAMGAGFYRSFRVKARGTYGTAFVLEKALTAEQTKQLEAFKNVHTGITEEVCAPEIRHQTIVLFDKCIK